MIDYGNLAKAQDFYSLCGFKPIEAPWTVTQAISDITKPPGGKDFPLVHEDSKVLVASGEQSFLYLYNKGFLPKGRFQTTTPCFRKESFGPFHTKYFMKTELIDTEDVSPFTLDVIVGCAQRFFDSLTSHQVDIVKTDTNSYDINIGGIEVGSYGIRSCSFLDWVYGTGIAEPRFSRVIHSLRGK